jgi:hypothetical protein
MKTRVLNHLTDHNILSNEQYGFKTKLKTDNATYQLTNEILNVLNNKLLIGGILCDFEKEFACVNHKILFSKLDSYVITGNHHKLSKSYLANRYQRTLLYNEIKNITMSTWCPPGFGFGTYAFLIFVSDLTKFVSDKSVSILYADDASILLFHSNPTGLITISTLFLKFLVIGVSKTYFPEILAIPNLLISQLKIIRKLK